MKEEEPFPAGDRLQEHVEDLHRLIWDYHNPGPVVFCISFFKFNKLQIVIKLVIND